MRRIGAGCIAVTYCTLLCGLGGCKSESAYQKEAAKALLVAKDVVAAINNGSLTWGDYDRLNSRRKATDFAFSVSPKSADANEQYSHELFEKSWVLFSARFYELGENKFINERIRTERSGGPSPTYRVSVDPNHIRSIREAVDELQNAYSGVQ